MVKTLLAAGADMEAKGGNGGTALIMASGAGHAKVVRALLAAGADVKAMDKKGNTALMVATKGDHGDVAAALATGEIETEKKNEL